MSLSDSLSLLHQLRFNKNATFNESSVLDILKQLALEAVADHVYSQSTEVILILLYSIIAAIGFASNAFILLVILTSKKLLSNPSSLLLANLMFSDIVMSLFCIPFTLIWFIRRSWSFGEILCKVIPFLQGLSIFLSSSTIATIAIDRLIRVTGDVIITSRSPVRNFHLTQIAIEAITIWTGSALLALPVLLSQELARVSLAEFSLDEFEVDEYVRCVDNMVRWEKLSYTLAILVAQYIVPVTILMFANFKIKNHLQRSLDRLKQATSNFHVESNSQADRHHLMREMKRNEKVMRTLSCLTGSFMLTWLPSTLVNMYVDIADPDIGDKLSLVLVLCHVTAMTSVPLNAFLYGWSNPIVRVEACHTWSLITEIVTRRRSRSSNNNGNFVNRSGLIATNRVSASPIRTSVTLSDAPQTVGLVVIESRGTASASAESGSD